MSLVFPLGMAALGALLPLVALYLLKQKRHEQKVPANFLWAQAMEDLRASSLFQRFRAPILFILQAAAIVLCALAAAGASLNLSIGRAPRHVILIVDRSASMKATDGIDAGTTRFDDARTLAKDVIDGLGSTDEMMVIAFDARSEVVQSFTPDRARLAEVIDSLVPRDLASRPSQAFQTALSFARQSRGYDPEIVLLSDGALEEEIPAIPFPVRFAKTGRSGSNQGIAAVTCTRVAGEGTQVFVRVDNGSEEPASRTVVLRRGSEVIDARRADIPPSADLTVFFELQDPDGTDPVEMTVSLEGKDDLPADDAAPFILRPATARTGLVVQTEPSIHLDAVKVQALRPGLALTPVTPAEAAAFFAAGSKADLVIYDGTPPDAIPPAPAQVYVDCVPPGTPLSDGGAIKDPVIIDWNRTHPITSRCQFDDVIVTEARKLVGHERSLPLIESTGGPLAVLAPIPGREVVVFAFSPSRSNLWLKLAWPMFLANTFDHLLGSAAREGEEAVMATGRPLALDGAGPFVATLPSGATAEVGTDALGRASFGGANQTGVYRFTGPDKKVRIHAFAMQEPAEVRIAPRDEVVVGGQATASDPSALKRNVLLRDPILLAVLGLLLLEWAIWCGRR